MTENQNNKKSSLTYGCVSDQVTQLSEVPTDRVKDSQQDVDVGGVKLCRIRRMSVLGQNLMQLTCKQMNEQRDTYKKNKKQSLSSGSHKKNRYYKKFLDSLTSNTMIHSL